MSAWGKSWGKSWGNSWGLIGSVVIVTPPTPSSGGGYSSKTYRVSQVSNYTKYIELQAKIEERDEEEVVAFIITELIKSGLL